jgi:spore germination cell wall hydrolase CwlJ-like protein
MNDAITLELGLEPDDAPLAARRLPVRAIAIAAIVLALVAAAFQFVAGPGFRHIRDALGGGRAAGAPAPAIRVTARQKQEVASLTVDDQAQIVVAGKVAEERNAAIPVSGLPLEKVRGFLVSAVKPAAATTALTCLTQAVYYEAAHEPMTGRRAVAQVVLNRMRHPAYPKSVCGVVYQGSERQTGCQFSFTCDGSLLRTPGAAAWREAQEVARAALAGYVEPSVGTATHYHADYVLPKWAFNLAKVEQIGAHIFYRFPGGWGSAKAFTGAYSGAEYIPAINYDTLRARQAGTVPLVAMNGAKGEVLTDGLTVPPHVTDRHDPRDVGGRINVTKLWRMTIQTPSESSKGYRAMLDAQGGDEEAKPLPVSNSAASAPVDG